MVDQPSTLVDVMSFTTADNVVVDDGALRVEPLLPRVPETSAEMDRFRKSHFYLNPTVRYQVTDELWAEVGGNIFWGQKDHTFFGQFEVNTHGYVTVRYAF